MHFLQQCTLHWIILSSWWALLVLKGVSLKRTSLLTEFGEMLEKGLTTVLQRTGPCNVGYAVYEGGLGAEWGGLAI